MAIVELNPRALAVVHEGRKGLRPPAGERERLEALLVARLDSASLAVATSSGGSRLALTLGVGLLSGAALLYQMQARSAVVAKMSSPTAPTALLPIASPSAERSTDAVPQAAEPPATSKARNEPPAPPRPRDTLAQEVTLLARATSDLRAGHAAGALKWVDEHQRKYPNGVLGVERIALRAQVLCSLKRANEGRAEVAQLVPGSLYAARASQGCEAEPVLPK